MAGRGRRASGSPTTTEIEYRRLLDAHEGSAETLRELADRRGVPYHRVRWWKSELARRDRLRAGGSGGASACAEPPAKRVAFVPVRLVPGGDRDEQRDVPPATWAAAYEVRLRGGRRVRVPSGFEPSTLTALVAALEAVPC